MTQRSQCSDCGGTECPRWELTCGPVVKTWGFAATDLGLILVGELRSHRPCGAENKRQREREEALLCRNHTLNSVWWVGRYQTGKFVSVAALHRQVFCKSVTVSKSESLKDEVARSTLLWYVDLKFPNQGSNRTPFSRRVQSSPPDCQETPYGSFYAKN